VKWQEIRVEACFSFREKKVEKEVECFPSSEEGQRVLLLRGQQTNIVSRDVLSTLSRMRCRKDKGGLVIIHARRT
jgi:hypothetical protein